MPFFLVTHFDPTGKQDLKQGGVGDCWFLSVTCRHCAKCDGISLLGSLLYRVKKSTQYCKGYSYGHAVSKPLGKGPIY